MQQPMAASPRDCSTLPPPAAPALFPPEASSTVRPTHDKTERLGPGPTQRPTAWPAQEDTAWPVQEDTAWPVQEDTASPADAVTAWPVQEDTAHPADADTTWPVHEDTACFMRSNAETRGAVPVHGPVQLGTPAQPCASPPQPSMHQAMPADSKRSTCPLLFDDDVADDALASIPIAEEGPNSPAAAAPPEGPNSPSCKACAIVFDGSDEDFDWQGGVACMAGTAEMNHGQGDGGLGAFQC